MNYSYDVISSHKEMTSFIVAKYCMDQSEGAAEDIYEKEDRFL